jgi:hypothetical protein
VSESKKPLWVSPEAHAAVAARAAEQQVTLTEAADRLILAGRNRLAATKRYRKSPRTRKPKAAGA